jgi:hypothetical protein
VLREQIHEVTKVFDLESHRREPYVTQLRRDGKSLRTCNSSSVRLSQNMVV